MEPLRAPSVHKKHLPKHFPRGVIESRRGPGAAGVGGWGAPGGVDVNKRDAEANKSLRETLFMHNLSSLIPNKIVASMC